MKFAEFCVFRTYIGVPNCECGCLLNKSDPEQVQSVFLLEMGQM